ncbi:MAG: O-antigen ligase family protein [Anaerosomatales bacterium]|nr:O-antigen ligase family protein [Anaerosomatales bacterium]
MAKKKASTVKPSTAAAQRSRPGAPQVAWASMDAFDRVAWICVHVMVVLVPLAVSNLGVVGIRAMPLTYDQFDIVKVFTMRALLLVAAAAWLSGLLLRGGKVRFTRVEWLVLAFLGWVLLTSVTSIHPPTAIFGKYRRFEGLLSFLTYGGWFFLALQLADRPSRIRSLARSLAIGGVLVAAYGVAQRFGIDPAPWGSLPFEQRRAFSTFGNPDLLGGYLIFPLAVALSLALSEKRREARAGWWAAFAVIGFCLLVSYVRGAWIGGTVAIVAIAAAALVARTPWTSVDWGAVGVSAVLAVVETVRSLSSTDGVTNVVARIKSIFEFGQGSALTRFQIWQAALAAIKERPILGWGADTFRLLFPRFKPRAYTGTAGYLSVADNVHNYPLQLASAIGVPGLLMLYGFFAWTLARTFRTVFVKGSGTERIVLAGFWAAALGYIVHLTFGLSITGSTVLLWLSLGLLLSPHAAVREVEAPSLGMPAAAAVCGLCAALFVGNVVYVRADNMYLKARIGSQGMTRVEYAEKAVKLNPYNDMYRTEIGLAWQDLFISQLMQGVDDPQSRERAQHYLSQAEREFLSVIDFVPTEYDNYVFLANLYNQASYYLDPAYADKAVEIARRGVEVEPFGPAIRVQLALALMTRGQFADAAAQAAEAADQDPNYVEAWMALGDARRLLGDLQGAKAAFERAVQLSGGRADAQQALQSVEASLAAKETTR